MIPLDDTVLFYLYKALGVDPSTASTFVSDFMVVAAFICLLLIFYGFSKTTIWFRYSCYYRWSFQHASSR